MLKSWLAWYFTGFIQRTATAVSTSVREFCHVQKILWVLQIFSSLFSEPKWEEVWNGYVIYGLELNKHLWSAHCNNSHPLNCKIIQNRTEIWTYLLLCKMYLKGSWIRFPFSIAIAGFLSFHWSLCLQILGQIYSKYMALIYLCSMVFKFNHEIVS